MKNEPFDLEKAAADKEAPPPDRIVCKHVQAMREDTEDHELWESKFNPGNAYLLSCDDCTGPMTEALLKMPPKYGSIVLEWRKPYFMLTEDTAVARMAAGGKDVVAISDRAKALQREAAKQFKN
ncbi:MAG TPA: hypothetical protein VOA88_01135 [Candidatus Dormibacteraeota bacterium]|nr:hypothetical protein [Candidatus Dormibacteraeota bacterium]